MIHSELCIACGGPLQLGIVFVLLCILYNMYTRVLQKPRPSPNSVALYSVVANDVNSKTANFGDD